MKAKIILAIFLIATIVAGILITQVNVNYDLKEYLPDDSKSVAALEIYDTQFNSGTYALLMIETESISEALSIKTDISEVEHVSQVVWLDSVLNETTFGTILANLDGLSQVFMQATMNAYLQSGLTYPEAFIELLALFPETERAVFEAQIDNYFVDGYAKMQVMLDLNQASLETGAVIDEIVNLLETADITFYLSGGVISTIFTRNTVSKEVLNITLVIIPIVLIILLLMTPAFFDLVVFAIVAAIAIILNLGTNVLLPNISFITQSMAIALQLAISLDYIIFIVNRYHKERDRGLEVDEALQLSMKKVKAPVIASALTTGVSFLALVFMRFSIGLDIGIVFFKAIFFSLLSSLILVPILIKYFAKLIDKSKHKVLMPRFGKFAKFIYKFRYVFLGFLILVIGPAYYFQSHNAFIYGDSALTSSVGSTYYEDTLAIEAEFGYDNRIIVLTEKDLAKEGIFYQTVTTDTSLPLNSIQAGIYYQQTISNPQVLASYLANLYTDDYQIMVLSFDMKEESDTAKAVVDKLYLYLETAGFEDTYLIGSSPIAYEIKDVISTDYFYVTLIALFAVMVIIFIAFRNLLMPLILPLVVVASVFFTMSIPYFIGDALVFLGYLIVSTILLGATIDYAILFGKSYLELRETYNKNDSIQIAISDSAPSIMTSAIIFAASGLSIALISSVYTISQIGMQIAIGATTSLIFVLVLLPQLFYIFDRWIKKSNVKEIQKQNKKRRS